VPIVAAQLCNRVADINNAQAHELLSLIKVARNLNHENFIFINGGDIEIRIGEIKNDFHTYCMN
jgi:hypothetical protein